MVRNETSILECLLFGGGLVLSVHHIEGIHLMIYSTRTGVIKTRIVDCFLYDIPHWVDIKL